jgi:hypothetical protein
MALEVDPHTKLVRIGCGECKAVLAFTAAQFENFIHTKVTLLVPGI